MPKGIGFFSDVHSNLLALTEMREVIQRRSDLRWIFGGDLVGWLYHPVGCVELLRHMCDEDEGLVSECVTGDHDLLALGEFRDADKPATVARRIATAYQAAALADKPFPQGFLRYMPLMLDREDEGIVVVHHSPFSLPTDRGLNKSDFSHLDQVFEQKLAPWSRCKWQVILSGHDHVPAVHRICRGILHPTLDDVTTYLPPRNGGGRAVPIEPEYQYWVQSGACGGPPRDGVLMLNWAEVVPEKEIRLHREPCDFREIRTVIDRDVIGGMSWDRFSLATDKPTARGSHIVHL